MTKIVKIMTAEEWTVFSEQGVLAGGRNDTKGFIHFSTVQQLARTANRWYTGQTDLVAAVVDPVVLGDALVWEPNPAGELFPHLYGELSIDNVLGCVPLDADADGEFAVPSGVEALDS